MKRSDLPKTIRWPDAYGGTGSRRVLSVVAAAALGATSSVPRRGRQADEKREVTRKDPRAALKDKEEK